MTLKTALSLFASVRFKTTRVCDHRQFHFRSVVPTVAASVAGFDFPIQTKSMHLIASRANLQPTEQILFFLALGSMITLKPGTNRILMDLGPL